MILMVILWFLNDYMSYSTAAIRVKDRVFYEMFWETGEAVFCEAAYYCIEALGISRRWWLFGVFVFLERCTI